MINVSEYNRWDMWKSIIFSLLVVCIMMILAAGCMSAGGSTEATPTPTPQIIYVTVTVTPTSTLTGWVYNSTAGHMEYIPTVAGANTPEQTPSVVSTGSSVSSQSGSLPLASSITLTNNDGTGHSNGITTKSFTTQAKGQVSFTFVGYAGSTLAGCNNGGRSSFTLTGTDIPERSIASFENPWSNTIALLPGTYTVKMYTCKLVDVTISNA
jgi:hypothetical protein